MASSEISALADSSEEAKLPRFDFALVGEEGVGKTSIYRRLDTNTFTVGTISTIGVDYFQQTHTLESGAKVNLRVWDTAGTERFRSTDHSYYRSMQAIIFVYSLDKSSSLGCLKFWIEDVMHYAPKNALWVFICNKIDLPMEDQVVYDHEIDAFFDSELGHSDIGTSRNLLRCKTSAKTGEGISEALEKALSAVAEKLKAEDSRRTENLEPSIRLQKNEQRRSAGEEGNCASC